MLKNEIEKGNILFERQKNTVKKPVEVGTYQQSPFLLHL